MARKLLLSALFLSLAVFLRPAGAGADVAVPDALALKGSPVMLKAVTKGRFFKKGGEVVRFYLNDRLLGRTLSGGDGAAYMEYLPSRTGLYRVKASSGDSEDEGLLLCLKKGDSLVFVDVVGALMEGVFSARPRGGSTDAVRNIMKKHPVLYLKTQILGAEHLKRWLRENGFPEAPVLEWRNGRVFRGVTGMGLGLRAVIGSPEVTESSGKYGAEAITFGEQGKAPKSWKEIGDSF